MRSDCPNCKVEFLGPMPRDAYIVYCPLHAAAQELYTQLDHLHHYAKYASISDTYKNSLAEREVLETLAKARVLQPADDSEMPLGPIQAKARGL